MKQLLFLSLALSFMICAQEAFDLHASPPAKVRKGSPLLLETLVTLRQEADARIELQDGAAWTTALRISLLDENGKTVDVEWEQLGAAQGPLRFGEDALEAAALFGLGPEGTARLAAGAYIVTVSLNTEGKSAGGAWSGRLESPQSRLVIVESDAPFGDGEAAFHQRARARWLALHGEREGALAVLDQFLAESPDHIDVMLDKADLLAEMDRKAEAVAVLDSALALFHKKNPKATHPPREILRRLHAAGAV